MKCQILFSEKNYLLSAELAQRIVRGELAILRINSFCAEIQYILPLQTV